MKASKQIAEEGVYKISVTGKAAEPPDENAPFAMQLYRNRVRLAVSESLPMLVWTGPLKKGDNIEADGERDIELTVEKRPEGS